MGRACTPYPNRAGEVEFLVRFLGRWQAVERNRVRRRLREVFRELMREKRLECACSVVLRARREWISCPISDIAHDLSLALGPVMSHKQ